MATCGRRRKLKWIHHLCKAKGEVAPASAIDAVDLFQEVAAAKRENVEPASRSKDLTQESKDVQTTKRLTWVIPEVAAARVLNLDALVKDANAI